MMTFDATSRETCYVLANRTNTPLQALNLMNDTAYVEASRKLAERMMREGRVSPPDRIDYGFRLVTARAPVPAETEVLVNGFHRYLDRFRTDSRQALALASQGESPRDQTLDIAELGAYTMVAGLILNLDEAVTKE
jgi:hypothetical protein